MTDNRFSAAQSPLLIVAPTQTEIELVRHFARLAAERDYKMFVATGTIPYASPLAEDSK